MGVQGLWDVLSTAGQSRSLAHLAVVDGFETNISGRRAYRVGIDASIWYQHAMHTPKKGANPELRLLFFRLLKLCQVPFIPLFVFDGRERPQIKRGSKKGKSGSHALTNGFKKLLEGFGMEWRMALGEAEAELAYLNRVGVIDAVLTDDADTFIFGAKIIIRNASLNLTGNRANPATDLNGKTSKYHVMTFSAESIRMHPEIQMTRGGLVLFALVSGGDYDNGLKNFGPQVAHCLARLGFGDQLIAEYERCQGRNMEAFLSRWRADMNTELHTNAHNLLRHKMPALTISPTFPDMEVLRCYVNPVCSVSAGRQGGGNLRDNGDLSIPRIATFCEDHFDEWGHRSAILKRFRAILWDAAVMRVLRRAALEADEKEENKRIAAGRMDTAIRGPLEPSIAEEVGTTAYLIKKYLSPTEIDRRAAAFVRRDEPAPAAPEPLLDDNPLIKKIVGARRHVSTDNIFEYRVEVDPTQLVRLAQSGIKGKHREPQEGNDDADDEDFPDLLEFFDSSQGGSQSKKSGPKNPPPEPCSIKRIWVPASIMRQVHPRLVEEFKTAAATKQTKKTGSKRKRQEDIEPDEGSEAEEIVPPAASPSKRAKETAVPAPGDRVIQQNRDLPSTSARGGRSAGIEIDIRAESSLPMRNCGFICTFPDPDSSDMLIMDDDENVGVLVDLDADEEPPLMAQHASQPAILSQPSTSSARPGTTRSRRESPQRRPRTGSVESSEEDDYNSDVHDDGVRSWQSAMINGARSQPRKDKSVARPPTTSSSTRGKGKGKGPPPRRPRASAPAASAARSSLDAVSAAFVDGMQGGDPDPDMDEDNDANAWMDALLLPRSKGKAPARGRPGRPRGSGTRGRPARNASSRRKTTHLAVAHASVNRSRSASPPRPRPRAARPSTPPPPVRAPEPMRLPSPLGARAQAQASGSSRAAQPRDERPLPLFFPSPSPPAPTPGRKRARSLHADDVIEIESSDDERPSLPAPKRRPRYARASDPSSSQPSRLSDTGYLRDAEVIIDLTV